VLWIIAKHLSKTDQGAIIVCFPIVSGGFLKDLFWILPAYCLLPIRRLSQDAKKDEHQSQSQEMRRWDMKGSLVHSWYR
jgi:hypothetical protein